MDGVESCFEILGFCYESKGMFVFWFVLCSSCLCLRVGRSVEVGVFVFVFS